MAKDNRIIHRGVSIGGKTFLPDQEDELAAAASPQQLERLKAKGAIEGEWETVPALPPPPDERDAKIESLETQLKAAQERISELETLAEPIKSLAPRVVAELRKAGFDSPEKVKAALDAELLDLWGINEGNLSQVRALSEI